MTEWLHRQRKRNMKDWQKIIMKSLKEKGLNITAKTLRMNCWLALQNAVLAIGENCAVHWYIINNC